MRRLASIVAILVLLVAVAPALACATDAILDHRDNACCVSMHGRCGEMAKTGCCRVEIRADQSPQMAAVSPSNHVHWVYLFQGAGAVAQPALKTRLFDSTNSDSPPGSPLAPFTVLRI
jgi:hypothetical protein